MASALSAVEETSIFWQQFKKYSGEKALSGGFQQTLDGDIQCVQFVELLDRPHALLPVPPEDRTPVTLYAEGNTGEVRALVNVVRLASALGITDAARERFDAGKM
jgi:hypothetical protein